MKIGPNIVLVLAATLAGCAAHQLPAQGSTRLVAANPTVEAPVMVNLPQPISPPRQLKAIVPEESNLDAELAAAGPAVRLPSPIRSAEIARARATITAAPDNYINAVAVYDFIPGQVYHIYTSPDFVTTIALRPGEKLISKVAGDTTRWIIGDTFTGNENDPSILVVLKPVRAGLHTNIMLATDQRVYFLDVESRSGNQYQNAISWNYPQEDLTNTLATVGRLNQQSRDTELTAVDIENLDYHYDITIESGASPAWLPKEVFDDGKKTYINFPDNIGTTEAPPLFIRSDDGEADLVNYRVKGHFYVVDRLFDHAELRVGKDPQTIVMISRQASSHARAQISASAGR